MLITDAIPYPTFANHESFHLRYGWLKKAYNAVIDNPGIFVSDDAPITLGVGKNMVKSMRFWALANKIIVPQGKIKDPKVEPTRMGDAIFQDRGGLDPYLEDPQTLWLLHWLLFAPPCRIPVWWIIMDEFTATNVRIEEMTEYVQNRITNMSEWHTPSPKSVKKDIDVFVHTYTTNQGKLTIEDYLDCPFRQMHMVKQSSRDAIRFVIGKKYGMTPDIVAFACLDFIIRLDIKSKSVSVSRLANEAGGVGNIFKIGENNLTEMLSEACQTNNQMRMENVNGAQHLVFEDVNVAAERTLGAAYARKKFKIPRVRKMEALITN